MPNTRPRPYFTNVGVVGIIYYSNYYYHYLFYRYWCYYLLFKSPPTHALIRFNFHRTKFMLPLECFIYRLHFAERWAEGQAQGVTRTVDAVCRGDQERGRHQCQLFLAGARPRWTFNLAWLIPSFFLFFILHLLNHTHHPVCVAHMSPKNLFLNNCVAMT